MKHTLINTFHPELKTVVLLSSFEESQRKERGLDVWSFLQATNNRRAKDILRRLDDSQPEAIVEND